MATVGARLLIMLILLLLVLLSGTTRLCTRDNGDHRGSVRIDSNNFAVFFSSGNMYRTYLPLPKASPLPVQSTSSQGCLWCC